MTPTNSDHATSRQAQTQSNFMVQPDKHDATVVSLVSWSKPDLGYVPSPMPPQPTPVHTHIHSSDRSAEAVQSRLRAALDPENDFQDSPSTSTLVESSRMSSNFSSSATLTRSEIIRILNSELSEPIVLPYQTNNIEEVVEIALIHSTVLDALGNGLVEELGLGFVPELGGDGKSLRMHLFQSEDLG